MKRSLGVVVSIAVVLAVGIALTHRTSGPPASPAIYVSDAPPALETEVPALETEVPGLGTEAGEEARAAAPVAGSDSPAETLRSDIAALREEVALLRAQVTVFERWRHAQRRTTTGERPGSEADPAQALRTDPAARAAIDRERQQQLAVIEAGFRREPADPQWATDTEGAVQVALAHDNIVQNTLLDLECRSQTCRVELADDNTGELAKGIPIFLLQLGSTLPNARMNSGVDGAGGKTMILYLTKEASPGR
jgi:hypothetical protein